MKIRAPGLTAIVRKGSWTVKLSSLHLLSEGTFTILKVGDLSFFRLFINQMRLLACPGDLSGLLSLQPQAGLCFLQAPTTTFF